MHAVKRGELRLLGGNQYNCNVRTQNGPAHKIQHCTWRPSEYEHSLAYGFQRECGQKKKSGFPLNFVFGVLPDTVKRENKVCCSVGSELAPVRVARLKLPWRCYWRRLSLAFDKKTRKKALRQERGTILARTTFSCSFGSCDIRRRIKE